MKYELTNETINFFGRKLFRIRALKNIGNNIKKGDLGGFIEGESNLSQEGDCWVFDNAKVCDDATVSGNAKVWGEAAVWDNATVSDNAKVSGNAKVYGNATVYGDAQLSKQTDVLTISPIGSRNDTTTFYKANGGKIFVKCGCKNTDIDAWLDMVKSTHGDNKHAKAYRLAAQIARLQILGEEV